MAKNILLKLGKFIKVIIFLIFIIIVFKIAPNYIKNEDYSKINLIINNNNVTKKLKYELFKNEKNDIYVSIKDLENFFDKYIYLDKDNNQIITTYDKKIGVFPINKKEIIINGAIKQINSGVIIKDNTIFLPITQMSNIYNIDMCILFSV